MIYLFSVATVEIGKVKDEFSEFDTHREYSDTSFQENIVVVLLE